MNDKVKELLDAKKAAEKKKYEEEKQKTLMELGLFEKVYSPEDGYSDEFPLYERDTSKHYKKIPIEITDEEYQEVKKYSKGNISIQSNNIIATILRAIAIVVYFVGFIAGIVIGNAVGEYSWEFSWGAAFAYWFITFFSGTIILGFAEIIQLLDDIKKK